MKTILLTLLSLIIGINLQAQAYQLKPDIELTIPAEAPYGVTYHGEHFWITDPGSGKRLCRKNSDIRTSVDPEALG